MKKQSSSAKMASFRMASMKFGSRRYGPATDTSAVASVSVDEIATKAERGRGGLSPSPPPLPPKGGLPPRCAARVTYDECYCQGYCQCYFQRNCQCNCHLLDPHYVQVPAPF